ncbi:MULTISPECIES: DUF2490 domain-containing protein [Flavobacteriaceae]|jgi:hypothetical protein|uniref:DUF2490 domain-containing protein n=2 Tax=Flavobacteriaceae TaxID=49546 RepID=A0ABN1JTM5_9FLAO|nr:DUF2490 domain-containing protein [Meridianimaribacter flavus]RYH74691.1 DUF2490 domain-containing protein [Flavobacteriaceae bacterium 144Ye]TBV26819.1 DUF2490 domain-containing protein [Meridianimaribacter sp. CL38]TDY12502.1 uncharacterized protein DUF2490 [Meridianimaribacter flavus]
MTKTARVLLLFSILTVSFTQSTKAQNPDQMGAWYMYFFDTQFKESKFGLQGDVQYRNWNIMGDLEQLLIRSGVTYRPKNTSVKLTLGYAHITSGALGESDDTSVESRIYQEALLPQKIGGRVYLTHRFRYEQRFVEDQDFRTRYRYNLFMNIPFNKKTFEKNTIYAALYNELFINGQQDIGDDRTVEFFDRNRTYLGLGYVLNSKIKFQLGWMNQKTNAQGKGQLQVSMHHKF